ncbi:hypothetical protein SAMN05192559_102325 [Halobacillus karajensis]|uniref:Uncharacterized protein n=1 Tax=Halobacillus karajensis TaxID=195088 RepID=A0A024P695_9BACI|nr:hypothetical protein [Halobacillus karajensis]CDQ17882.1 hypothetical protein BN982_00120 [Halobacillus karajensis]CDQ24288.1 hypothetical protein BN983_02560 [Halobacillus karajensis]CDQ29463.1 hypothetical protein BN981_03846 [Halobacillus karajensis]SEH62295.1 hypothetical protein SAMN05192559_102325 [Halobacillus karajensis]
MVLRRDGFGGSKYYPQNSELSIICTYENAGQTYIIVQYLDLPFCYRLVNRDGLLLLEEPVYNFLLKEMDKIDAGVYTNYTLSMKICNLMKQQK